MQYRQFGRLDWRVSALGFGAMRLPVIEGDPSRIDESQAIEMIRYAIDQGVNYVDTAYGYHRGNSEIVVGKALGEGYRERIKLATKMPTWLVNSQEDMDRYLSEQLMKLKTDHIDLYLLHGLQRERWDKVHKAGVLEWAEKAKEEGKISYLGFSFHDEFPVLKEIVDSYDRWTFCQIQYNFIDSNIQAGTRGLRYAASRGLAVVVMEPIKGGLLAVPPPEIRAIWDEAELRRKPAEWALQWVWDQPEVSVALSGMSNMNQVVENVQSASRSGVASLKKKELDLITASGNKYLEYGFIGCTGCRYCTPCPSGVEIPRIFALQNEYFRSGEEEGIVAKYKEEISAEKRANKCQRCGRCEALCPQELPIIDLLSRASMHFDRAS